MMPRKAVPTSVLEALLQDDGLAARSYLEEGRTISYEDATFPEGLVRKHSDGRPADVRIGAEGQIDVLHEI